MSRGQAEIDPRVLRTYLAVCREGSISGAARRLAVSQPSVSVAITQLEGKLGCSLFKRGRQGIVLTEAGVALMRRAEMLEALLRDAADAVRLAQAGARGPLRIGGTPGALVSLVPGAVALLEADSHMALHILEAPDAALTDLLRRGEIEVAVVTTGIERPPADIDEIDVARDPFALIVGRAHQRLGPSVSLRDTASMGWVLPRAAGAFHRQIDALFLSAGMAVPADVIRCDSLLTSKAIVREGRRVTILPRGVVAAELASGVLREVSLAGVGISRTIGIRTVRERALSDLGRRFVAVLTDGEP